MGSGMSKWTNEAKNPTKEGTVYVESRPMLCDCGGAIPIGGDAKKTASFFYDGSEWVCVSCGRVLAPTIRDYEMNVGNFKP